MKNKKSFVEDEVIRSLSKKKVIFAIGKKTVDVTKAQDLGNGSWAKIGFLTHFCGWTLIGQHQYAHPAETDQKFIIIRNPLITNQRRIIC